MAASNVILLVYAGGLLFSSVGNSIFFKKMTDALPNYPYFLSQITTLLYIPIFWSLVWYELYFTDYITNDMRAFPKRKFFVMGALDAMQGILMLFGGVHTSGSLQIMLNQAVIPVTMFLSYIIIQERYKRAQYTGATIILVGILTVLLPDVINSKSGTDNSIVFNMLFLSASIPNALSSVYKEVAFSAVEMDINLLQAWVALWQLIFGLLLAPLNAVLGDSPMPVSEIPNALLHGAMCFGGINSIVTDCYMKGTPQIKDLPQCDDCATAWIPLTLYMFFNVFFNVFVVLVIKYGGANILNFVMTLRLPLVQLAFSLSFVRNPPDIFHWYAIVGLMIIISGLLVYRYGHKYLDPASDPNENEKPLLNNMDVAVSAQAIQDRVDKTEVRRGAQGIRSGLYARLGIHNSPSTRQFRDSFRDKSKGSIGSSGYQEVKQVESSLSP